MKCVFVDIFGDFQRIDRLELKLGKKYIKSEHIGKKPVCFFYAKRRSENRWQEQKGMRRKM